jgi:hypothetical protein
MTLNFPNPSRSFDASKNRVTFWGYDSVIEISFSVEGDALLKLHPGTVETEAGFLEAFDAEQKSIRRVAKSAYLNRRRKDTFVYNLVVGDF